MNVYLVILGCFGLLVTSPLGFKARVGSFIRAWQMRTCYTFSEIKFLPTAIELSECNYLSLCSTGEGFLCEHYPWYIKSHSSPPRLAPLWTWDLTVERDSSLVTSGGHHWRLGHFILSLDSWINQWSIVNLQTLLIRLVDTDQFHMKPKLSSFIAD